MAKRVGISSRLVQRIWEAPRLQAHRVHTFKRSHDPAFAEKIEDVVGLYMEPFVRTVELILPRFRGHL